ncbi:hypothetical protein BKI52_42870 [marine bacterium AO1-C]|nr:hypothetical protein BKI52_42870 [marine bacterium AO1-C]
MNKQNLHSDNYLEAFYDKKLNLVELYWKEPTEDMTEAEYRMIISDISDEIHKIVEQGKQKAPNWLLDNRKFMFTMSPKLQEWQADKIFGPLLELGCRKGAVVMSEDLISQFAIEQTFEENSEARLATQYFGNLEQANVWLQEVD